MRHNHISYRHNHLLVALFLVMLGVGVTGQIKEFISKAATGTASNEAENGLVTSPATAFNDTSASNGRALLFKAVSYQPGAVGTYKPTAGSTGYQPYGLTLKAYTGQFGVISNGTLTITQANTVISGYDIPARIVIKADNVVIQKSLIRGDTTVAQTFDQALVECATDQVTGCVIQDSVLRPDNPSLYWNGIRGHDFVAQRNEIYNVTDGIDVFNINGTNPTLNVVIAANYIHDLTLFGPDYPNNRVSTHNDCIQWVGGNTVVIRGNNLQGFLNPDIGQAKTSQANPTSGTVKNGSTMEGYNPLYPKMNANSALQVTQPYGQARNLVFDKNWVDGGGFALNFATNGDTAGVVGNVTNNIFGRNEAYGSGNTVSTILSHNGFTFGKPSVPLTQDSSDPAHKNSGPGTYDSADNGNNRFADTGEFIYIRQYSN